MARNDTLNLSQLPRSEAEAVIESERVEPVLGYGFVAKNVHVRRLASSGAYALSADRRVSMLVSSRSHGGINALRARC